MVASDAVRLFGGEVEDRSSFIINNTPVINIRAISYLVNYEIRQKINHGYSRKRMPTPQPTPTIADPNIKVYSPDFSLLSPISAALAQPKLKSSTTPMHMTASSCCSYDFRIPDETMQGIAGKTPNRRKAKKVTKPHFAAIDSSITTRPSSSSIIMFTKACLFVLQSSAIREESSSVKPLALQMLIISLIYSACIFSTSQSYLAYSALMNWISERAERQSPSPIPMLSPTTAEMQNASILAADVLELTPLSTIIKVLMQPSSPPQTKDLRYSPAWICPSLCFSSS